MASEYSRVMEILKQNADKTFVQRILGRYVSPNIDVGDGNYATHKMAWGESDGTYYVYPTVQMVNGKLTDLGDKAFDRAKKNGEFIVFGSPEDADWFSQRYKAAWGQ